MSYILEALKKLEEKSRREAAPYLLSQEYSDRYRRKKNFPWRYLLALGLFLNLGIFLWVLHTGVPEKGLETGAGNAGLKAPLQRPPDTGRGSADITRGLPQPQPMMKTQEGPSAVNGDGGSAASPPASGAAFDRTPKNAKIIGIKELPLAVRQGLPDLSISGHFYDSRPSARVVTVGGKILHEGDAAAPGVMLERITPDGVVFVCGGYRFHEGVFQAE